MQEVQLYIEGTRIDFFDFESISVTSSIQNVKDIAKVFTDFSQSFTVPASKTNNKLFKHYYNADIDGFDARTKKDAVIEVNSVPFREGKIKLNGVKMKNNKAYAYDITFFGNTVNLKDLLGDDQIDQIPLSSFDHDFDASTGLTGLTTSLSGGSVVYPLLTHTQRYTYDSGGTHEAGNIAYHTTHSKGHGIQHYELKPALRVNDIISAIETKYSITFSNDFFDTSVEAFTNLFLWLHRAKGRIGATSSGEIQLSIPDNFAWLSGDDYLTFIENNSIVLMINTI